MREKCRSSFHLFLLTSLLLHYFQWKDKNGVITLDEFVDAIDKLNDCIELTAHSAASNASSAKSKFIIPGEGASLGHMHRNTSAEFNEVNMYAYKSGNRSRSDTADSDSKSASRRGTLQRTQRKSLITTPK